MATPNLLDRAHSFAPRLVEIRRDLHRHPELSYQEVRTAGVAAHEVGALGFSVQTGIARTGVVAELENGTGPTIALRADMDALPIQEESESAYASSVPGVMHACGHDFHTAGLIGAARLLSEMKAGGTLPAGKIRLLFQPSEESSDSEGKSGAMRMIEEGAMKGVNAVVGLHVGAHLPAGKLLFTEGPIFGGSDEVHVTVRGRSAHAARPHEGVDALALSALGIVAAQQVVSRNLAPWEKGVLSLGKIEGGRAGNVICDRVTIAGTLRYFDRSVQDRIQAGVRGAFSIADAMGGSSEIAFNSGYPPVVNDVRTTRWVREAILPLIGGEEGILGIEPSLEAEDFAFLAQEAPGTFFWLGAALPDPREHHHPRFDVDEKILPLGSAILAQAAVQLLTKLR